MEKIIKLKTQDEAQAVCGAHDHQLKAIEREFKVKITLRQDQLKISGYSSNIKKAEEFINQILLGSSGGLPEIGPDESNHSRYDFRKDKNFDYEKKGLLSGQHHISGKQVSPRTKGQREYAEAIKKYDIVFGIGPAGTGKTYLAMSCAVEALKKNEVRRIILTRPAIEAGESLGFLPGDMYEKISPYLRPLYDALYDMMDAVVIEKYLETGIIEIAPLAYMRGRTLNDAFIIMDEAQNATAEQMKMFLTRLGFDSKAVITGDLTQSDLPRSKPTGLLQAQDILNGIEGIKFIYLTGEDIVRHALVQEIIEAYDKTNRQK